MPSRRKSKKSASYGTELEDTATLTTNGGRASPRGADEPRAFGEYNPYDEVGAVAHDGGRRRVGFGWARTFYGDDDDGEERRCSSFCCFTLPLLVIIFCGLIAAFVLGVLAIHANKNTPQFGDHCGFVKSGPLGLTLTAALMAVVLIPILILTRYVWLFTTAPSYACCPSGGMVCARVGFAVSFVLLLVITYGGVAMGTLLFSIADQYPNLNAHVTVDANAHGGFPAAPVTVVRDGNGLVHVEATSIEDAVFGQGFAQAQDRLWQMEFQRLVAAGRLAEHVGKPGLKLDKQLRRLGAGRAAELMCTHASAATRRNLEAFVAGINAFLRSDDHARPIEFYFMSTSWWPLIRHEPNDFSPVDVCYAAKLLQLQLGGNMNWEAERFRLWWAHSKSGNASYRDINTLYTNQSGMPDTILTAQDLGITAADVATQRAREEATFAREQQLYESDFATMRDSGRYGAPYSDDDEESNNAADEKPSYDLFEMIATHASNAWAARAANAPACGASDPHLQINLPSVWYYTHLIVRGDGANASRITYETSGVGMAGIPGVHIGKNQHVSWGITMAITDLQDLYVAVPATTNDPDTHYRLANGTELAYTIRTETIRYKKGFLGFGSVGEETMAVKETIYGPDVAPILKLPTGMVASVKSVILQDDTTSVDAVVGFIDPTLQTTSDLCRLVFQRLRAPAFSVPSADLSGNLGYCISGAYRDRAVGHTGMWPTLGDGRFDDSATEIPTSALPQLQLSSTAVGQRGGASISAANQKIYPDGFAHVLGYEYIPPLRGGRLHQVLEDPANRAQLSNISLHVSLQTDTTSNIWTLRLRSVVAAQRDNLLPCLTSEAHMLLDELISWDAQTPIGSTTPARLWNWIRKLSTVASPITSTVDKAHWPPFLFTPSLLNTDPQLAAPNTTAFYHRLCQSSDLLKDGSAGRVCAPASAEAQRLPSSCWQAAAVALNRAAAMGPQSWGNDVSKLDATNLMMSKSPLACVFDRSVAKDGDPTSVDVKDFKIDKSAAFTADHASSMRQLYDWSAPTTVRFAWPGGASGYPYSPRYDNLMARFTRDEYVPVAVEDGIAAVPDIEFRTELLP